MQFKITMVNTIHDPHERRQRLAQLFAVFERGSRGGNDSTIGQNAGTSLTEENTAASSEFPRPGDATATETPESTRPADFSVNGRSKQKVE